MMKSGIFFFPVLLSTLLLENSCMQSKDGVKSVPGSSGNQEMNQLN
ncbi:MAG: hypothetical protein AAGC45_09935 [Bacteroidota bacterium]